MKSRGVAMKKLSPLLVFALLLAAGCGEAKKGDHYVAALRPMNRSGVDGSAALSVRKHDVTVHIRATGLEPDEIHPQKVFGIPQGQAACPTSSSDANGDGFVELKEGARAWGRPVLSLLPYPTAPASGNIDWLRQIQLSSGERDRLEPVRGRVIVLEGKTANTGGRFHSVYRPTLPVACGTIAKR
jgi:hypothetical protein